MQGEVLLGKYVVSRHIGGGGMAQVYLSEIRDHPGQYAAIKVMNTEQAVRPRSVERFKRESTIMCTLDHPNLVKGFEFGQYNDRWAVAMEYVEGPSLEQLLSRRGHLSVEESLKLLLEIAEGLDYLHASGGIVAHRDIKPGNILITTSGIAKITDLGIAKAVDEGENLTGTSSFLGSPNYMSPEQILDPKSVDIRTDLYALGAMFYEMVAGQKAYPGTNTKEILDAHFNLSAPTISDGAQYTDLCNAILERTLADEPTERFANPRELVQFLAPALGEEVRVAVVKHPKSNTRLALVAVAAAAVLVAGGAYAVASNIKSEPPKVPAVTEQPTEEQPTVDSSEKPAAGITINKNLERNGQGASVGGSGGVSASGADTASEALGGN